MRSANRYDGLACEVIACIRVHARCLARKPVCNGTSLEDLEQDLALDLLARSRCYDPARASFATFADRLVRNRVATLLASAGTTAARAERHAESLDTPPARGVEPLAGRLDTNNSLWPSGRADPDQDVTLRVDVDRFVRRLPPPLRRACWWLLADDRRQAARQLGRNRSTLYDDRDRLRIHAIEAGFDAYLSTNPTVGDLTR